MSRVLRILSEVYFLNVNGCNSSNPIRQRETKTEQAERRQGSKRFGEVQTPPNGKTQHTWSLLVCSKKRLHHKVHQKPAWNQKKKELLQNKAGWYFHKGYWSLLTGTFIRGCWEPNLRWQNSNQTFDKTFTVAWKPKQRHSRGTFSLGREGKVGSWEAFIRFCLSVASRRIQVDLWLMQPRIGCWYWSALSSGADYSEGSVLIIPT